MIRRVVGVVGRLLASAGVLILLFVVYQLWGTSLVEARAQDALEDEFAAALATPETQSRQGERGSAATATTTTTQVAAEWSAPEEGSAVARLEIPVIGVDKIVVEGVGQQDLRRGPGHYPGTPLPGQAGNAAIAGHRTTYGAPFYRLDELGPGDVIRVTTASGRFSYEVTDSEVVPPTRVDVLEDFGDDRLTLTTCNPRYSAAERLIITARLDRPPGSMAETTDRPIPPTTGPMTASPQDGPAGSEVGGRRITRRQLRTHAARCAVGRRDRGRLGPDLASRTPMATRAGVCTRIGPVPDRVVHVLRESEPTPPVKCVTEQHSGFERCSVAFHPAARGRRRPASSIRRRPPDLRLRGVDHPAVTGPPAILSVRTRRVRSTAMPRRKLPPGELENQVLEVLWDAAEPMTPGAVHEVVAVDRKLAYTTVMTILTRLWEKGELTRSKQGRAYAYLPVVGREERVAQRMQAILGAAEDHTVALNAFADALPEEQRAALRKALGRRGSQR